MSIISQLSTINRHIRTLEKKYHRTHNSVALLAVTKKQPAEKIREAYNAGQHLFAENYVQESIKKNLNVCIEVNIDEEKTKSGVLPNDVFELAKKITGLKYLKLRGLMIIPEKNNSKT